MNPVYKYFTGLSENQKRQIDQLQELYMEWNQRINVISRKDMDAFYEHHVLHSMAIGKFINFEKKSRIIDVGTGGGFPGIPLAILFPEVHFTLIDSIGKKIKVVQAVIDALELNNATAIQKRSEEHKETYDFIVSRAVTKLPEFKKQTQHLISKKQNNALPNGIIYLKGGDISAETKPFGKRAYTLPLSQYYKEEFFNTKKVVHLAL